MGKALTIFVMLALSSGMASADTLLDAAHDAATLCLKVGAFSLEHCGTSMAGKSPEMSAARRQVGQMLKLRDARVRACGDDYKRRSCIEGIDLMIEAGISRAEAQAFDSSEIPASQPATQR